MLSKMEKRLLIIIALVTLGVFGLADILSGHLKATWAGVAIAVFFGTIIMQDWMDNKKSKKGKGLKVLWDRIKNTDPHGPALAGFAYLMVILLLYKLDVLPPSQDISNFSVLDGVIVFPVLVVMAWIVIAVIARKGES